MSKKKKNVFLILEPGTKERTHSNPYPGKMRYGASLKLGFLGPNLAVMIMLV